MLHTTGVSHPLSSCISQICGAKFCAVEWQGGNVQTTRVYVIRSVSVCAIRFMRKEMKLFSKISHETNITDEAFYTVSKNIINIYALVIISYCFILFNLFISFH